MTTAVTPTADGPVGRARARSRLLAVTWSVVPPALVVGALLALATRHGLTPWDAVRASVAVLVVQTLPGAVVWRSVRTWRATALEDLVAGTAVGAVLAVGAQATAGLTGRPVLSFAGLLVLLALGVPEVRRRVRRAPVAAPPPWWGLSCSVFLLPVVPALESFHRTTPVAWGDGFREIYVDIHFHLALVGQLLHRGPTSVPYVLDEPLRYHWFSHAWVADIAATSGVEAEIVLLRVAPSLLAALVALTAGVVAARLSGRWGAGPVAVLVALGSADVNLLRPLTPSGGGRYMTPGALSLGFSGLLVVTLLLLVAMRWRTRRTRSGDALVVLLAVGATGAKGSSLPLLVAGAALALVVCLWRRRSATPVLRDLVLLTGTLAAMLGLVLGGAAGRGTLDPVQALRETGLSTWLLRPVVDPSPALLVLSVVVVLVGALARAAPLLLAAVSDGEPQDPVLALLVGVALAGVGVVLVLTVPGTSQLYFLRNAVPLMAVGTAVGLVRLLEPLGSSGARLVLAGVGGGISAPFVLLALFGRVDRIVPDLAGTAAVRLVVLLVVLAVPAAVVARRPGRLREMGIALAIGLAVLSLVPSLEGRWSAMNGEVAPPREPQQRFGVSADQIAAARWLRDHSDPTDVVATNRHCASPVWVECDSRRFAVAAYTERQVLVEGWAYTRSWSLSPPRVDEPDVYRYFTDPERLAVNDAVFDDPSPATVSALGDIGVDWLFVDLTEEYDPAILDLADLRLRTEWALVMELPDPEITR